VIENGSEIIGLLEREQLRPFSSAPAADDCTTIVWVGSFDPWQGVKILVSAFAKAIQQIPNLRLILIGDGPEFNNVKSEIHRMGIADQITLTGRVNIHQVAEYLSKSDIGVAPYCGWMEYSGLKLFDYKSAGLAIIASGQNGQPATIKHGTTGIIVPPCDENTLCEAICRLAPDIELRQQLGRAARIEAEQIHGWEHTTALLDRTLDQVFNPARPM
jgi:glycosyltransferase involved in cell wall biosynthesis